MENLNLKSELAFIDTRLEDIVGTAANPINPLLGSWQNNGGNTPSHPLLFGSLAINAGNNALILLDTLDLDGDGITTEISPLDQRRVGFERIFEATVDIGGLEKIPPQAIKISVFSEPNRPLSELNSKPGTFIFQLSAPAPVGGLIVNFQAGDTDPIPTSRDVTIGDLGTTNIDNFNIRPIPGFISTVTISEGATEGRLVVTPFADGLVEADEIISLSLLEGDGYTVNPINNFADFTIIDGTVNGIGAEKTIVVRSLNTITVNNFGGIGRGNNPDAETLAEVDILKFKGTDLTVQNLLLTQNGDDLKISFETINHTEVILSNFDLEKLDNLANGVGNILFAGDKTIQNSFDVINKNSNPKQVLSRNTVTFLNDLNNKVKGLNNSDDVINGQGGNDKINGLSGDDLLRGGIGKDTLLGGTGDDLLFGGEGDDRLTGGSGLDKFYFSDVSSFNVLGTDTLTDFAKGSDKIVLSQSLFNSLTAGSSLIASEFVKITVSSATELSVVGSSSALIVYNTSTGNLFYNPDGSTLGLGDGGQFGILSNKAILALTDFELI